MHKLPIDTEYTDTYIECDCISNADVSENNYTIKGNKKMMKENYNLKNK